jgi:hypothetical protein
MPGHRVGARGELLDEERIALRAVVDAVHEQRGSGATKQVGDDLRGGVPVETVLLHPVHPAEPVHLAEETVAAGGRVCSSSER